MLADMTRGRGVYIFETFYNERGFSYMELLLKYLNFNRWSTKEELRNNLPKGGGVEFMIHFLNYAFPKLVGCFPKFYRK